MDRVTRHLVFQLPQTSHRHDLSDRVENGYGWKVRSKSPSYFLDGGKDVWTPSPDRESKLEVVRSGSLYDLRAYRGERKPSKLYDEDEQEQYRVPPPNISPEKARELEDERREVIRSQVMRKSSTMADLGSQATPVDPENIDTEQINFSAARQQFLMLEKTNPGSFVSPGQQAMSPRPESVTRVSRQEWSSPEMTTKAAKGYGNAGASNLDSGLGEMYNEGNAGYTSDGSTSNEVFNGLVDLRDGSNGLDKEMKISNETPIEREIRMAMEREENLWKERGIPRLTSSSELVEIQTKPLLSMLTSPGPGRKGKDRGRASLYLQREIEQETKREEALKKQGRLLGTYDRGTQQELDERRRVFEQEEAPPQKPIPTRNADEQRIWIREFVVQQPPSHSPHHTEDTRGGRSLPSSTLSTTHFQGSQPRFTASEKSQDQPLVSQHVSASTSKWGSKDSWGGRLPGSTPSPPGTTVLPREYFSFSFWKPKVSFVDEMGTQSPLRREDSRDEQYKLRTWKPQTSAMIEEEIRSDLQREEELQEQRRQRQLIDGYSVVSSDGFPQEDSRSRHSSGKGELGQGTGTSLLPSRVSAGTIRGAGVSPREGIGYKNKLFIKRHCASWFLQVVESTRVVRHKSAMAQRWEAGQYVRDED
uniref:A-kinase anchor protein 2 C-terminal domain-containing protein n=1 Tax=Calidris pygmaea TaxID=425635 RepID=A0A8C3K5K2_9CHAR